MRRWAKCEKVRDRALKWEEEDSKRNEERWVRAGKRKVIGDVERRNVCSENVSWGDQAGIIVLFILP